MTANNDPTPSVEEVAARDGWACQRCGIDIDPDGERSVYANYRGDKSDISNYETRCQKCEGKRNDHKYRFDRHMAYLVFLPIYIAGSLLILLFSLTPGVALMTAKVSAVSDATPMAEALTLPGYLVARFVVGPLCIVVGIIALVIFTQIIVWCEPTHGVLYRSSSWVWDRTFAKLLAGLRRRIATATSDIRQRVNLG